MPSICAKNFTALQTGSHFSRIKWLFIGSLLFACNTFLFARGELTTLPAAITIAPVLGNIESDDLLYPPGNAGISITNTMTVSDADSKSIRSASVRINSGFNPSEDVLLFKRQNKISGSWNKSTGVLTLSGSSSIANYQLALRSIQYENTNTINPSAATRIVTFQVNDGTMNSNILNRNIVILSSNTAPRLTNIETVPLVYCTSSGATAITSAIRVSDPDNASLSLAKVQIVTGYIQDEDFLRFTDQNGITGSWDILTGTLTLSGNATIANYQTALRFILYENANSLNPAPGNRNISFIVNDGKDFSREATRSISVNGRVSAILTGSTGICLDNNTTAPLDIDLSGTPPWRITLIRDNGNEVNYNNITLDPFTIQVNLEGIYRIKSISDANCIGDTTGSGYAKVTYNTAPTATISGHDTICKGDTARLQVVLTGTPPWNIFVLLNGANPTEMKNIPSANYILRCTGTGTYTLAGVEDAVCRGKGSGTGIVSERRAPAAAISGNATICEHTAANLNVAFTGEAPWRFSYKLNDEAPVEVQNVLSSPGILPVFRGGTYTLFDVSDKHCKGTVSGAAVITLIPAPEVTISGLSPVYARDDHQMIRISVTPEGGTFSGFGLFFSDPNWFFLPRYAPIGTDSIVYSYRESPGSCYGYDTVIVNVIETNGTITFPNDRLKYCQNEAPFLIKGVNLANSIGTFTISGEAGLVDNLDNTATIDPSVLGVSEYTITYTYTGDTSLATISTFEVGPAPVADFQWKTECYEPGQPIAFNNTSSPKFGNISDYFWKIPTSTGYDTTTRRDIVYTFPRPGSYSIEMQVQTSYGCKDSIVKAFMLRAAIPLADSTYFENFDALPMGWQSGTSQSVTMNSWTLGNPSKGFSGAYSGEYCWYTKITASDAPNEESWITSPCFDFTGTKKPMVKLNVWRLFNSLRDGATLQATADSGKTWRLIGQLADGVNWFNEYTILGNPGGQSVGWSNIRDAGWLESRHSLDMLKGKSKVQFRIAYGSDGTARNTDGIAFDNFWIGERNRTTLLEHFTNASSEQSKGADSVLSNLVHADSLNIINMQYHTSFPGIDPFNEQEPNTPDTRVLYYGLSDVPYSILNGGSNASSRFDYNLRPLDATTIQIGSLVNSKFTININSALNNNILNIETEVSAQEDLPTREFTVHVAVIERKITDVTGNNGETTFKNVVKTLLPDAAGTTLFKAWAKNEYRFIENNWAMENVYNPAELRVVAFIQDESTKEVYQAAMDTIGIFSGTDPEIPGNGSDLPFIVYPNPASQRVFVRFEKPISGDVRIALCNNLGSIVYAGQFSGTTGEIEVQTADYPNGLYVIRVIAGNQVMETKKLTIMR